MSAATAANKVKKANTRGWEQPQKKNVVVTSPPPTGPNPATFHATTSEEDKLAHRNAYLYFLQSIVGSDVEVELSDGRKFQGTFFCATPFSVQEFKVVLKFVKRSDGVAREDDNIKAGSTLVITGTDLVSLTVDKLDLANKSGNGELKTDSAISKNHLANLAGRDLQAVGSDWLVPETETSTLSGTGEWDQFEVNRRLYNVTSTFDENLYTKKLDKSKISIEQQRFADRMAREIESQTTDNSHLREERGHALEKEMDEEDLYSGVIREKEEVWGRGKGVGKGKPVAAGKDLRSPKAADKPQSSSPLGAPPGLSLPSATAEPAGSGPASSEPSVQAEVPKEVVPSEASEPPKEELKAVVEPEKPKGLNPSAKPFTMRASAHEFVPVMPAPAMPMGHMMPMGGYYPMPMQMMPPPPFEGYPPQFSQTPPMGYPMPPMDMYGNIIGYPYGPMQMPYNPAEAYYGSPQGQGQGQGQGRGQGGYGRGQGGQYGKGGGQQRKNQRQGGDNRGPQTQQRQEASTGEGDNIKVEQQPGTRPQEEEPEEYNFMAEPPPDDAPK